MAQSWPLSDAQIQEAFRKINSDDSYELCIDEMENPRSPRINPLGLEDIHDAQIDYAMRDIPQGAEQFMLDHMEIVENVPIKAPAHHRLLERLRRAHSKVLRDRVGA